MAAESSGAAGAVMYGQRAKDLLHEIKSADTLPPYNDEAVRAVLAETAALEKEIVDVTREARELPTDTGLQVPSVVYDASIARNRRCLVAYHHRRCDLIDELKWACGTAGLPPDAKSKLSSAEQDYFNGYGNLITAYIAATGVDIMSDLQPPKENYVEVVALRDCGRLMTMTGHRDVREREVHFVRKYDAEQMIRKGWLSHIADK